MQEERKLVNRSLAILDLRLIRLDYKPIRHVQVCFFYSHCSTFLEGCWWLCCQVRSSSHVHQHLCNFYVCEEFKPHIVLLHCTSVYQPPFTHNCRSPSVEIAFSTSLSGLFFHIAPRSSGTFYRTMRFLQTLCLRQKLQHTAC